MTEPEGWAPRRRREPSDALWRAVVLNETARADRAKQREAAAREREAAARAEQRKAAARERKTAARAAQQVAGENAAAAPRLVTPRRPVSSEVSQEPPPTPDFSSSSQSSSSHLREIAARPNHPLSGQLQFEEWWGGYRRWQMNGLSEEVKPLIHMYWAQLEKARQQRAVGSPGLDNQHHVEAAQRAVGEEASQQPGPGAGEQAADTGSSRAERIAAHRARLVEQQSSSGHVGKDKGKGRGF